MYFEHFLMKLFLLQIGNVRKGNGRSWELVNIIDEGTKESEREMVLLDCERNEFRKETSKFVLHLLWFNLHLRPSG